MSNFIALAVAALMTATGASATESLYESAAHSAYPNLPLDAAVAVASAKECAGWSLQLPALRGDPERTQELESVMVNTGCPDTVPHQLATVRAKYRHNRAVRRAIAAALRGSR